MFLRGRVYPLLFSPLLSFSFIHVYVKTSYRVYMYIKYQIYPKIIALKLVYYYSFSYLCNVFKRGYIHNVLYVVCSLTFWGGNSKKPLIVAAIKGLKCYLCSQYKEYGRKDSVFRLFHQIILLLINLKIQML